MFTKKKKIYSAFDDSYVEYQSNGDRDKSISIARYLNNIREHLRKRVEDSINNKN